MLVAIGGKEEASATPPLPPRPCIYAREKWRQRRGRRETTKIYKKKEKRTRRRWQKSAVIIMIKPCMFKAKAN